jgi:hypothetical protein
VYFYILVCGLYGNLYMLPFFFILSVWEIIRFK